MGKARTVYVIPTECPYFEPSEEKLKLILKKQKRCNRLIGLFGGSATALVLFLSIWGACGASGEDI